MSKEQGVWSEEQRDVRFYVGELRSDGCVCGKEKKPGKSFCFACWRKLPGNLQADLYLRIGDGYEAAYDAAGEWLEGQ